MISSRVSQRKRGGSGGNRSRVEQARVATTGGENNGQSNGREERITTDTESLPPYDPDSLITHINALDTQERDDLLDRIMNAAHVLKGAKLV